MELLEWFSGVLGFRNFSAVRLKFRVMEKSLMACQEDEIPFFGESPYRIA
tara:strand:+ start:508 stop:657 length:150 start_codon:yes stop_codon:yes gene_type:complete